MSDDKKTEHRAKRMGFVFQFYNLLPVLSAVENVELPLLVSGVSAKEARKKAMDALEVVHSTDWATHKPAELSGGQRQRVTIARALVNDPAIVWGDEPTGDLDSTNADEIMELLIELNRDTEPDVRPRHPRPGHRPAHRRIIRMQDGQIISDEPVVNGRPALGACGADRDRSGLGGSHGLSLRPLNEYHHDRVAGAACRQPRHGGVRRRCATGSSS